MVSSSGNFVYVLNWWFLVVLLCQDNDHSVKRSRVLIPLIAKVCLRNLRNLFVVEFWPPFSACLVLCFPFPCKTHCSMFWYHTIFFTISASKTGFIRYLNSSIYFKYQSLFWLNVRINTLRISNGLFADYFINFLI